MGGFFDNKVVDALPAAGERLVWNLLNRETPSGIPIPKIGWTKPDVIPELLMGDGKDGGRQYANQAASLLTQFIQNPDGSLNHKRLAEFNQGAGAHLSEFVADRMIKQKLNGLLPNTEPVSKHLDWKTLSEVTEADGVDPATRLWMSDYQRNRAIADPPIDRGEGGLTREQKRMSITRFLVHAIQAGAVGATALSIPYILKRQKQLRAMKREAKEREEAKQIKSANGAIQKGIDATADAIDRLAGYFRGTGPDDYYNRTYQGWKSSPYVLPAAAVALMGTYGLTQKQIMKVIDTHSDRTQDKRQKELDKELTRLMVSEKRVKEASRVKSAGTSAGDKAKVENGADPALGALALLWTILTPSFYALGKRLGRDASGASEYEQYVNALDAYQRSQPDRFNFNPSTAGDLTTLPGTHLGTTHISLPIPDKNRGKDKDLEEETW